MDEKEYWTEIYLLLKGDWPPELESLGYCDWIEASTYLFGPNEPHIEGRIGLVGGSANRIRFILYLAGKPDDLSEIRWHESLPDVKSDGWISFDSASETLELDATRARSLTGNLSR